jgi:hypothetical protein
MAFCELLSVSKCTSSDIFENWRAEKKHFILFSNDEFVKQILKKKSNLT